MMRISDCKYLLAVVYESAIRIQRTEAFFALFDLQVNKFGLSEFLTFFRKRNLK